MSDLGYTGILSGMINTDRALAQNEALKQRNAINALALDQARINSDIEARSRIALQEEANRQLQAGVSPQTTGDLSSGLVSEPSMGEAQGPKLSDLHMKEYNSVLGFAKAMAGAGNVEGHLKHQKAAQDVLAKVKAAQTEERQQHKEKWTGILNLASAPFDEDSLNTAFNVAKQKYGRDFENALNQMGFNQLPDGRYVWDDNAKAKVKAIKELAVDEVNRVKDADRDAKRVIDEARLKEQERHNKEMEAAKRDQQKLERDNQEIRRIQQDAINEQRKERQKAQYIRSQQGILNRDPVYQNWTKWEMGLDTAQGFREKLQADPKAIQNGKIESSQIHNLATTFKNMNETFRAQSGGRYQMQEIGKFNGLYDKFKKYYDSFGRGTDVLSEDRAFDMANTMIEMFDIANRNVVLASMETANRVNKKFGNGGDDIALKGNIQRLIRSGQGKVTVKDGKRFIEIGNRSFEVTEED